MKHGGGNLSARDYLVERIPHAEAVALIREWHYARTASNTGQTFGLLRRDDYPLSPIMGAALWLPPARPSAEAVAGDDWRGVLSLSRLTVDPDLPRNAASYLLAGSMRLLDRERWPVLVTYADTARGHTGAIYRATGWTFDREVSGSSYFVHRVDGRQVGMKRGSWNLSAAQLRAAGFDRVESVKLRFVHRVK